MESRGQSLSPPQIAVAGLMEKERIMNAIDQQVSPVKNASRQTFRRSPRPPSPRPPQVADIMSRTVVTATEDTPLPDLIDQMVGHGISGIPIVNHESVLVGIVTEADLISKVAYGGTHRRPLAVLGEALRGHERHWEVKAAGLTAGQIMTTEVETARPQEAVQAAARRMVRHSIKRLPVVDRRPCGRNRIASRRARPDAPHRRCLEGGDRRRSR